MNEEITKAITTLTWTMEALEKASNEEATFNTELGYQLQQMSWEMQRSAAQLKELRYTYC